tara:strand:+ start:189 stop:923 length:735 start_codon:yes stop_codon:yes gene_type:complete
MAGPNDKNYDKLQEFGRTIKKLGSGIYGGADIALGGALPGGPIQSEGFPQPATLVDAGSMSQPTQNFNIPLQAYIDKRMIKGDVLRGLKSDVDYYVRNGLEPEAAVRLVIGNKRQQFVNTLNPESPQYAAIQQGDRETPLGKAAHNSANIFKYFESASPKEYEEMFSDFGITDASFVRDEFRTPDRPNAPMGILAKMGTAGGIVDAGINMLKSGVKTGGEKIRESGLGPYSTGVAPSMGPRGGK